MSRRQQDADRSRRMIRALDAHDPVTEKWIKDGIGRLNAMANHPCGRQFAAAGPKESALRECTPPSWSPAPDPAHEQPNRSIWRDALTCLRALVNPNHKAHKEERS